MARPPFHLEHFPFAATGAAAFVLGLAVPLAWDAPFLALLGCAVLSLMFESRHAPPTRPAGVYWVLLFALSFAASTAASIDLLTSLKLSAALLPAGLIYFLIAGQFASVNHVRVLFVALSATTALAAGLLIVEVWKLPHGNTAMWMDALASPIFLVPNDLLLLAIAAPMSLILALHDHTRAVRILAVAALVLSALAITFYQSRTGLLTLLISTAACAWFLNPRLAAIFGVALVLLGGLADAMIGFPLLEKFSRLAEHRFALWLAAWNMFLDAPLLGHGPQTYGALLTSYVHDLRLDDWPLLKDWVRPWPRGMHAPWAHNLYLETLAAQGVLGLIAVTGVLGSALTLAWKMKARAEGPLRPYAVALLSALAGFAVAGGYELSFLRIWVTVVLFVLVALTACLWRLNAAPDSHAPFHLRN